MLSCIIGPHRVDVRGRSQCGDCVESEVRVLIKHTHKFTHTQSLSHTHSLKVPSDILP